MQPVRSSPQNPPKRVSTSNEKTFHANLHKVHCATDQLFLALLVGQWVFSILLAALVSPYTWAGAVREIHPHVKAAVVLGGLLNIPAILLIRSRPGWWITRHVIAIVQMSWSALLIHISGGRIETHFHVFGSLAFLAFYRDWKVLPTATAAVAADHLLRGALWPESIYGISNPEWWRFVEHAAWLAFEDAILILGCRRAIQEMRRDAAREAAIAQTKFRIEQEVKDRTAELVQSMDRYRALVENTQAIPWEFDPETEALTYVAPQAHRLLGLPESVDLRGSFLLDAIHPDDRANVIRRIVKLARSTSAKGDQFDYRLVAANHSIVTVRAVISPRKAHEPLRGIALDITQQKQLEFELNQAQKLESVGRLAAGVAHEINTPIQFVNDSVHFLRDAVNDLIGIVGRLQEVRESVLAGQPDEEAANETVEAEQDADLDYLIENVPKAIDRSLDGLSRVATIVRSMKEFAHPDSREMTPVDLNRAIESTLSIARNEYKYVAELETEFGELPLVVCYAGEINQAILNITVNAAHAVGDVVKSTGSKGRIKVRTWRDGEYAAISITDTGGGIPSHVQPKIFDPFFTTKEVGKGTGQGLPIVRSVIVDKHKGTISFETEEGKGTTFFIRLPIEGPPPDVSQDEMERLNRSMDLEEQEAPAAI